MAGYTTKLRSETMHFPVGNIIQIAASVRQLIALKMNNVDPD